MSSRVRSAEYGFFTRCFLIYHTNNCVGGPSLRIPEGYGLSGDMSFTWGNLGFSKLRQFYQSQDGTAFASLWQKVDVLLREPCRQDGRMFSTLQADCWMCAFSSEELVSGVRAGKYFHVTRQEAEFRELPKLLCLSPAHHDMDASSVVKRQFGYIIGEITREADWFTIQKKLLQLERLLRMALFRIQDAGLRACDEIHKVVLFAFIAVPNIPTVHGIADVGFACLSSFLSRNKDAVPLLWSMHVHGALFFLEVPDEELDTVPRFAPKDPGLQVVRSQVAQLQQDVSDIRSRLTTLEVRQRTHQQREQKFRGVVAAVLRSLGHPALDKVLAEHTDIFGQDSSADVGDGGTALAGSSTDQAKMGRSPSSPTAQLAGVVKTLFPPGTEESAGNTTQAGQDPMSELPSTPSAQSLASLFKPV